MSLLEKSTYRITFQTTGADGVPNGRPQRDEFDAHLPEAKRRANDALSLLVAHRLWGKVTLDEWQSGKWVELPAKDVFER